ncbi:MAG: hypothetical protein ABI554_06780 [Flavobacterium sp.]
MKNRFKCSMLLLVAMVFVLQGCSKDDGGGGNTTGKEFLTFKMNGKTVDYSALVNANDKPLEKEVHFVVIGGHETDDFLSPGFGIDLLVKDGGATTKTYTTAEDDLRGQYYIQNVKDGKIVSTYNYNGDGTDGSNFVLKITRLDANGVAGTFSGTLIGEDGDVLNITDGSFSANYNGVN